MAKVMVTMPEKFLKQVERTPTTDRPHRNKLIRQAMRAYFAERATGKPPTRLSKSSIRAAIALQDRTREELRGVKFDSVAFIRKMRGPLK
jgi:metal-responsive CopG/Arc/MetJ family transcriptional regulator